MKNHGHRKLHWTFAYNNPLSIPLATKMPAWKLDFCGTIPLEISIVNTNGYEQNISSKTAQKCLVTKYLIFSAQLRSRNHQIWPEILKKCSNMLGLPFHQEMRKSI
jgi:hypothetical protein